MARVEACLDGGEWFPMERTGDCEWRCPLLGTRLAKGEHKLESRAIDEQGGVGNHAIAFHVDRSGRYTAVPRVRPETTHTKFC